MEVNVDIKQLKATEFKSLADEGKLAAIRLQVRCADVSQTGAGFKFKQGPDHYSFLPLLFNSDTENGASLLNADEIPLQVHRAISIIGERLDKFLYGSLDVTFGEYVLREVKGYEIKVFTHGLNNRTN